MELDIVVTPALGDNSYVIASGDEAAVIDPQRDADRMLQAARDLGATVRHVLETHVHNDYLSGGLEIRQATGAEIHAPARGGYEFPHRPVHEGDEIRVGELRVLALETPGHTPEHVAYLVHEGDGGLPSAVFTGGSLMVAGAGRTDLLGMDRATELTRQQYRTLHRLAELPDDVRVMPTHGAGSFCGAGPAPKNRTSTIGEERAGNRALSAPDEERFVEQQLSGLLAFPTYYREMAPLNRAGPRVVGQPSPPPALEPAAVEALLGRDGWLVDGRPRRAFAAEHVPGSLNVELEDDFGSYVGWVVPFAAPLALVVPEPVEDSLREAVVQLFRIGYDRVEGFLAGGIEAWRDEGRAVHSYPSADVDDLCAEYRSGRRPEVLDVRQRTEWDAGHIPGSGHAFVGDLPQRIAEVPAGGEVWTICATGHRASLAASLLDRAGIRPRLVARGGVEDWIRTCLGAAELP